MLTSALNCVPEMVAIGRLHERCFMSGVWVEWGQLKELGTHGQRDGFRQYRDA